MLMCDPQQAKQTLVEAKKFIRIRTRLPASAFCGPNRTMPCHDAEHVKRSLRTLALHKGNYQAAVYVKMLHCVIRRAKKFNVPISPELAKKLSTKSTELRKPFVFR